MRNAQSYLVPSSLDEAVACVATRPGRAVYLGGGTWLATSDDPGIDTLVDLAPLGLDRIETGPQVTRVGAMVSLERLRHAPTAAMGNGVLGLALERTRSVAWRNQATLGGHLRQCDPTDWVTTALLLREARCIVQSAAGVAPAPVPLGELARLPPQALVVAVDIPAALGLRSTLESLQETALAPPLAAVGVAIGIDAHGTVGVVRVASCGLTRLPARAARLEAALLGARAPIPFDTALRAFDADIDPVDDWRASATYRAHLGRTLLARALRRALETRAEAAR